MPNPPDAQPTHDPFDTMLLSQARLGVISVLMSRAEATFTELRELLGLTQGNLGAHLRQLEEAGYIAVRKEFAGRKPRTSAQLTQVGRAAFLRHLQRLTDIADNS
ncbi:MAG: transcriptional regulator [Planctomycetota bacterium]